METICSTLFQELTCIPHLCLPDQTEQVSRHIYPMTETDWTSKILRVSQTMHSVQRNANIMNQQVSQNIKPMVLKSVIHEIIFVFLMYIWQEENNTGYL